MNCTTSQTSSQDLSVSQKVRLFLSSQSPLIVVKKQEYHNFSFILKTVNWRAPLQSWHLTLKQLLHKEWAHGHPHNQTLKFNFITELKFENILLDCATSGLSFRLGDLSFIGWHSFEDLTSELPFLCSLFVLFFQKKNVRT